MSSKAHAAAQPATFPGLHAAIALAILGIALCGTAARADTSAPADTAQPSDPPMEPDDWLFTN